MRKLVVKRALSIGAILGLPTCGAFAVDDGVMIQMPQADVRSVLDFYSTITRRQVFLDISVQGAVAIQIDKPISKEEAILLIRTTLLEKHGIEMREPNAKETFVTWSADPKYKEVIEATKKPAISSPLPPNPPAGRVRVVR